jgi:hypothetical protein
MTKYPSRSTEEFIYRIMEVDKKAAESSPEEAVMT